MSVPTFVVGTGRCGSTMLSNMLRNHPQVLSLSEFFALIKFGNGVSQTFSPEPLDGTGFWSMLAAISPMAEFFSRNRFAVPEQLYDRNAPGARFPWPSAIPAILETTLPHLTDAPDQLFDALGAEVQRWPSAPLGEHYSHLFAWLAARFAKRLWVERSGTSLLMVNQFLATFPEARFVHMVRDGRDAAISMRQHLGLKLGLGMNALQQHLGVDPIRSSDRTHIDRVPPELRAFLPESFDAEALRAFDVPLPLCGEFWTQQISAGLGALSGLPEGRVLTICYEDFFVDPKERLDALAAFLGDEFIDEAWSKGCAATVRKPGSAWRDLPERDVQALTAICRPGFDSLSEAGLHYELN
jgi:putative sulfotransferase